MVSRDLASANARRGERPAGGPTAPRAQVASAAQAAGTLPSAATIAGTTLLPAVPVDSPVPAAEGGSADDGDGSSHSPGPGLGRGSGVPPSSPTGECIESRVGGRSGVLGRASSENFPVAPRVLPPEVRGDLRAIYGYARLVDELGDEAPGDRTALLDVVAADVDRLAGGQPPLLSLVADLAPLILERGAPIRPLLDLIQANRVDQVRSRYQTFADLRDYCRLSADPVGRLVLHAFGSASPERVELSDRICTALQLIEHLQDVAEDHRRGRVYLPMEDMYRYRVDDADLTGATTPARLRRLIAFEADRARLLLDSGARLVGTLHGWARLAVAGYVGGGRAALDALERTGYDISAGAPKASRGRIVRAAGRCWATGR